MIRTQQQLDQLLNRRHTFPVEVDALGPLPATAAYSPLKNIEHRGFSFAAQTLLHAIGCKTTPLPRSQQDECLRSAHLFTHVLDLEQVPLCFIGKLGDLQTNRSMELGIGMTCLFAHRHWAIPWDQLQPIPGRGLRFDYRGRGRLPDGGTRAGKRRRVINAIFESKGTKYRASQSKQVIHGRKKKAAHHRRGDRFDVELIVSTHVGSSGQKPRILIADPPMDNR